MQNPNSPKDRGNAIHGRISVRGILGDAVSQLGTAIVGGRWAEGEAISKEAHLVEELEVSRSVIREACRILGAKGLIKSRTSDGTRVQPRSSWRLLDPDVMDWRIQAGDRKRLLTDLLKFRYVVEPGIAYVAAETTDQAARDRIDRAWEAKKTAYFEDTPDELARRDAFIDTDIAFHEAFVNAANSEMLGQIFGTISSALELLFDHQMRARGYTDRMVGMEETHELHERVYEAFVKRDAVGAELAMRSLINCAIQDAELGFNPLED
ncbi:MAG: FadR/GntR family transcriptional regulator [Marinosulfonomonas sp.]